MVAVVACCARKAQKILHDLWKGRMGGEGMSLRDEIGQWLTPDGAVTLNREGIESDNSVLFTVIAWALPGLWDPASEPGEVLANRKRGIGKYARRVQDRFPSSHDDHLAAAAHLPSYAAEIVAYGATHLWCWGWGQWPNLRKSMSRKEALKEMFGYYFNWQPIFKPAVLMMAQLPCGPLQQLKFAFGFWLNGLHKGPDNSRLRLWLVQDRCYGKHWFTDQVIDWWRAKVGDPGQIFRDYFPKEHPLSKYAPTSW